MSHGHTYLHLSFQTAWDARLQGIKLFVVGVGHSLNQMELNNIVSHGNKQFLYRVDTFEQLNSGLKDLLVNRLCEEVGKIHYNIIILALCHLGWDFNYLRWTLTVFFNAFLWNLCWTISQNT